MGNWDAHNRESPIKQEANTAVLCSVRLVFYSVWTQIPGQCSLSSEGNHKVPSMA